MKKLIKTIVNLPREILKFLVETVSELKYTEWLKANQVVKYTIFVVAFLFIGAILIVLIDKGFLAIRSLIILK